MEREGWIVAVLAVLLPILYTVMYWPIKQKPSKEGESNE
jgi:hypothetical protein